MNQQSDRSPIVSLIVPVKDDAKYLGQCLQSLIDQNYPADRIEILVVDGRSQDGSQDIAREFTNGDRRVRVLENPRICTAAGANIGLEAGRGGLLGIFSSHSTLDPNYVSTIVMLLDDRPDVACAGGSMRTVGSGYVGQAIALVLSSPFGVGSSKFRTSDREQIVDTLAFGLYRRSVFDEIGLFDERLVRNEDNDLNWRLRKSGGQLLLTPSCRSYYYAPDTWRKFSRQAFNNGLWNIRQLRLAGVGLSGRHFVPLFFILALITSAFALPFGRPELLVTIGAVYFGASTIASGAGALKGGWRFFPILPILFLLIHLSYGLGSAAGLVEAAAGLGARRSNRAEPPLIDKPDGRKEKVL